MYQRKDSPFIVLLLSQSKLTSEYAGHSQALQELSRIKIIIYNII